MNTTFSPCTQCNRHVLVEATECPFCHTALDARDLAESLHDELAPGLSRRELLLAVSAGLVACQSAMAPAEVYGAPPPPREGHRDAAVAVDATNRQTVPVPPYGAPPPRGNGR